MSTSSTRAARLVQLLRDQPIFLIFIATFGVVAMLNPMKVALLVYGINKLMLFSWIGYKIDAWLFRTARPDDLEGQAQGAAWKRRAWIVVACIAFAALLP